MSTPTTPGSTPTTAPGTAQHMTYEQAEILSTLVNSLRPDWGRQGITSALEKLALTMDATTLALGLMHAAAISTNRSPAVILHPGKHWDAARGLTTRRPAPTHSGGGVDTSPMCENHPELHEWECKTCKQPSPPPPNFKQMVAEATEAARRAMNAALDTVQDDLDLAAPAAD